MTRDPGQRLSAALRAQAAAVPAGRSPRRDPAATPPPPDRDRRTTQSGSGLPSWMVLALAVLLGALAGGLAGVISVW